MTVTLADLTLDVARLITDVAHGFATSTETLKTQLTDNVRLPYYPSNLFTGGTIWITSGACAGKVRVVSDFLKTGIVTFPTLTTAVITTGDAYYICDCNTVNLIQLRQAVLLALMEIGYITVINQTIETEDGKTVYALPDGVSKIADVEIVTNLGEDDEYAYKSTHWRENAETISFDDECEPDGGRIIRIYYEHLYEMTDDTDELNTQIDERYLTYIAARQALRIRARNVGQIRDDIPEHYNQIVADAEKTKIEWLNEAINEMQRHIKRNRTPIIRMHTA